MSKSSLYIVSTVNYINIIDEMKEVYNNWKEYLFLIVELRNAWEKDLSFFN
jgi:hypothetical protein